MYDVSAGPLEIFHIYIYIFTKDLIIIKKKILRMTFLSLFFSTISSFPALAACRDSCLEVNFEIVLTESVYLIFTIMSEHKSGYLEPLP